MLRRNVYNWHKFQRDMDLMCLLLLDQNRPIEARLDLSVCNVGQTYQAKTEIIKKSEMTNRYGCFELKSKLHEYVIQMSLQVKLN